MFSKHIFQVFFNFGGIFSFLGNFTWFYHHKIYMTTTTNNIRVSLSMYFQVSNLNVANVDALTTGGATGGGGKGGATGAVGGSSTSK